jgi:hypothetical protein
VSSIQPGIESLSTNVLRLMRKGVRAAQNVNLMRWARYYGIHVDWNLIWGFPGESPQDYAEQAAVIPHLRHLPPPASADRIWLERFSPLFTDQGAFRWRAPERSYRYIYPNHVDLDRVAYFFDSELHDALPEDTYTALGQAVTDWAGAWQTASPPTLEYWSAPHLVQIYDGREAGEGGTYTFEDTLADLYLACASRPVTAAAVRRRLGLSLPEEGIYELFEEFRNRGLMFLDGQYALALALPAIKAR